MISKQAATGFSGLGTLKADSIAEAGAFCAKRSQQILVTQSTESIPPYVLGNFPRVEVHFQCLNSDDPSFGRPRYDNSLVK